MAYGTPERTERNKEIFSLKRTYTFSELAKKYKLTPTRIKQIYYRERERRKAG